MSAATAAFLGSGRRMWATVAPPTTVNRACDWWRNLIQLRTPVPATLDSATGQLRTHAAQHYERRENIATTGLWCRIYAFLAALFAEDGEPPARPAGGLKMDHRFQALVAPTDVMADLT